MRLWVLAILTLLKLSTVATLSKSSWGLENEALIVTCPRQAQSRNHVDWYYSKTNKSITTQKENRIFASGKHLKLLPANVGDSGMYTCIVRSSNFNKTGYVNITIYKKQPGCKIPDDLIYSTTSTSPKKSRIYCPTINLYNWTAPVEWFKGCTALQGSRYYTQGTYLLIDNATSKDAGDYTCKFMHNENGVSYIVTATRSLEIQDQEGFSIFPVIIAPAQNETNDVEIGFQFSAAVLWEVNRIKVRSFGEARIQEGQEQNQSSSNDLTCLSIVLRIADVREEDFSLRYDCLALNLHGLRRHTIRLRKKPSKKCF
ncbi:interleukin 1 receptor like 1 [Rhinolophus ferrumequinum]|uniref:Interleukin-1 receptor-like 1 n=1 Tax=Rhinolophus ferrumequinum TaxID=59479 RepID=A0A7J7V828_RHIFE|nr:interleukin 1 receptor like 1 [Rhinolophus ferrumequinum]